MAFEPQTAVTAVSIGNIVVILKDAFDEEGQPYKSIHYQLRIVMSDGSKLRRAGNLAPHLTTQQRQGLLNFMDSLRTQAESEVLP